jgi:UDP-N-acetylglucosamine 3-dehydrogenase
VISSLSMDLHIPDSSNDFKQSKSISSSMHKGINLAVFGAGHWGTKICEEYAYIENSTAEVNLCEIVDSSEIALNTVRETLANPICSSTSLRFSTDYSKVLSNAEVDAVHISLPNQMHYSVARASLESRKSVLLEKPIAMSSREAFKLTRLAEEMGLVLFVGHIFRFNDALRTIKKILTSRAMGRIYYANVNWTNYMDSSLAGQDIFFDLAYHPVDILNFLIDEWPIKVDAIGNSYVQKKNDSSEIVFVNLEFPDGILANLHLSRIQQGAKERMVKIVCEKGTLSCDTLTQIIKLDQDPKSSDIFLLPPDLAIVEKNKNGSLFVRKQNGANNSMRDMQYHFLERMKNRGPLLSSGMIGSQTVVVLESIISAVRSRKNQKVQQYVYA